MHAWMDDCIHVLDGISLVPKSKMARAFVSVIVYLRIKVPYKWSWDVCWTIAKSR